MRTKLCDSHNSIFQYVTEEAKLSNEADRRSRFEAITPFLDGAPVVKIAFYRSSMLLKLHFIGV